MNSLVEKYSLLIVRVICLGFGLISTIQFTKILGIHEFGIYSLYTNVLIMSVVLGSFGQQNLTLDRLPKSIVDKKNDIVSEILITRFVGCTFGLVIGALANYYIKSFIEGPINYFLLPLSVSCFCLNYLNCFTLRAFKKFKLSMLFDNAVYLTVVLVISYFFYPLGMISIFEIIFVSYILVSLITSLMVFKVLINYCNEQGVHINFMKFNALKIKFYESIKLGLPFLFLSSIEVVSNNIDVMIIGHFLDASSISIYTVAKKFLLFYSLAFYLFNYKNVINLSEAFSVKNKENNKQHEIVKKVMATNKKIFFITLLGGVPFLIMSQELVRIAFGVDFVGGIYLYASFFIFVLINIAFGPTISFINVSGLSRLAPLIIIPGLLISLLFSVLLISNYELLGVSISFTLGLLTWKVIGWLVIKNKFGYNISIFGNSYV